MSCVRVQQDELVEQLQAQHHQQYVTQVLPALQRHQHEQRRQLAIVARTRARQATAAADGDPDAGAPASHGVPLARTNAHCFH